jgi:uncharacterized membrane protein YgcG
MDNQNDTLGIFALIIFCLVTASATYFNLAIARAKATGDFNPKANKTKNRKRLTIQQNSSAIDFLDVIGELAIESSHTTHHHSHHSSDYGHGDHSGHGHSGHSDFGGGHDGGGFF